ncbi:MAG: copper amine oxidase N-terminal domain-containing protein [Tissierellia bacterium]|nr:copper amine oxidase N-terminal domain-containing protein [Tissierellia bacterium]
MRRFKILLILLAVLVLVPNRIVLAEGEDFEELLNSQIEIIEKERQETYASIKLQLITQGKLSMFEIFKAQIDPGFDHMIQQLKDYYHKGYAPSSSGVRKMVFESDYVNPKFDPKYDVFLTIDNLFISRSEDVKFFLENMRTYVPLRFISENLGFVVDYNEDSKEISINNKDSSISMKLGEDVYTLNGEEKTMDVKPIIIDDKTYVPIRFVVEGLGFEVEWHEEFKVVNIITK